MPIPYRSAAAALTATILLAACGGGGSDETASTTAASTTVAKTTTSSSSTSTSTTVEKTTTTESTTTTTTIPLVVNPLTGLPPDDPLVAFRPALVVKIDNHPEARPQQGLDQADIVIEEIVEGITRFFTVFHSNAPEQVGPIRSARTTDVDLLGAFSTPMFAWSGGNPGVTNAINHSDSHPVSPNNREAGWFRMAGRRAPHNLFASPAGIWSLTPEGQGQPAPVFEYRKPGEAPQVGEPFQGVRMGLDGTRAQWLWDPASGSYLREENGSPHTDADGAQLSASNVVILTTEYVRSAADARSPEAVTVGSGEVRVLKDGALLRGTWERPDAKSGWTLKTLDGTPILLAPGRTWVELAKDGDVAEIPNGEDPGAFPFP